MLADLHFSTEQKHNRGSLLFISALKCKSAIVFASYPAFTSALEQASAIVPASAPPERAPG